MKFSKQDSGFDNKFKSTVKQQDNGCQLSQNSSSLSVEDSGFFKDFKVLFHGAVGPLGLRPVGGLRAYAPEGGRANFLNQVVTF